eukprot:4435276-Amphidinium_carterae.1
MQPESPTNRNKFVCYAALPPELTRIPICNAIEARFWPPESTTPQLLPNVGVLTRSIKEYGRREDFGSHTDSKP